MVGVPLPGAGAIRRAGCTGLLRAQRAGGQVGAAGCGAAGRSRDTASDRGIGGRKVLAAESRIDAATSGWCSRAGLGEVARRVIRPTGNPQATGISLPADTGPGGGVNGVAFSPDGNLLASADADGTVGLWNTATGQAIASLPADSGVGVAFSPNGNLLASADADGTVQTWHMSLFANPYAALCADVGSPTSADWAQYAPGEPQPSVCG